MVTFSTDRLYSIEINSIIVYSTRDDSHLLVFTSGGVTSGVATGGQGGAVAPPTDSKLHNFIIKNYN